MFAHFATERGNGSDDIEAEPIWWQPQSLGGGRFGLRWIPKKMRADRLIWLFYSAGPAQLQTPLASMKDNISAWFANLFSNCYFDSRVVVALGLFALDRFQKGARVYRQRFIQPLAFPFLFARFASCMALAEWQLNDCSKGLSFSWFWNASRWDEVGCCLLTVCWLLSEAAWGFGRFLARLANDLHIHAPWKQHGLQELDKSG